MDEECIFLCLLRTFLCVGSFLDEDYKHMIKMFTSYHLKYILDTNISGSPPVLSLTCQHFLSSSFGKDFPFYLFYINLFSPIFFQKGNPHPLCLYWALWAIKKSFLFFSMPYFWTCFFLFIFKIELKAHFLHVLWCEYTSITSVTLAPLIVMYSVKIFILLYM